MSSPKLEEEGVLREWAPLSKLLHQIPMKMRQGMFLEDLRFTSVDATTECIVLGSNCGTCFWYDRGTHYVQHLRPEKGANAITCVKVVSTVDFMVACGDNTGIVSIFKIPKSLENFSGSGTNISQKIERYTVDGLHKTTVTALEWSMNGQKLFSGDSDGVVVFTEMDFIMNISKAREVLNEKYSIVQLNYNQREQILLVASKLRCIIWRGQNTNHTITQIGQRERPSLLSLGGTLVYEESGEVTVYSCRGGLKLWKADLTGDVKYTLLFKEALKNCKNPVKLLKQLDSVENNNKLPELGSIYSWRDGLFVSFTKDSIIVFDPHQLTVVATLLNAKEIVWACTTRTELFLISGQRDLIRLGYTPDLYDSSIGGFGNMATGECVSGLPEVSIEPIYGSPVSASLSRNSYLSASTANSELSSSEVIYGTDPSVLPPVVSLHDGIPELRIQPSRYQQFTTIGKQGFDDIIYSQKRLQKHKNRRKSAELVEQKQKSSRLSFDGFASYVNSFGKFLNGEFSSSVCDGELEPMVNSEISPDILPDMRDLETIVQDVTRKEMLLEASLETLMANLHPLESSPETVDSNCKKEVSEQPINLIGPVPRSDKEINVKTVEINLSLPKEKVILISKEIDSISIKSNLQEPESDNVISIDDKNPSCINQNITEEPENSIREVNLEVETESNENKILVENIELLNGQGSDNVSVDDCNYVGEDIDEITFPLSVSDSGIYAGWFTLNCPEHSAFLSVWKAGIILCSPKFDVYYTTEDHWASLNYKAQIVMVSNSGNIGVRIHCAIAQYSDNWKGSGNWEILCRDVQHVAVTDDEIWFVSRGDLFCLSVKDKKVHPVPCEAKLSKIYTYNTVLYAITMHGLVLKFENDRWQCIKGIKNCRFMCIGPNNLIWFVDSGNGLFIIDSVKDNKAFCWQVSVTSSKDKEITSICSNGEAIYTLITGNNTSSILFNKTYVTGHIWSSAGLKLECFQIAAAGIFEEKGCVWVVDTTNKLIALDSSLIILEEVDTPCNIVCIASSPEALWLLADDGSVYLRQGISNTYSYYNPVGKKWRKLNMEQLHSQVELVSLSCGPDAVWACDIRGKVVMVVGSPHHIAEDTFIPVWVGVDGKPIENNTFTKDSKITLCSKVQITHPEP
ncbi:tectonin beta-propeller repeat-containing protein 2 isoform X2 [Halyomorpha halys]|uniref:tectonin beta-propeller repeat-containing protein 2 isoform X2 n=1 Tax=Halyomorpha halys TaxID=286706 RepID=UPI0034D2C3CC